MLQYIVSLALTNTLTEKDFVEKMASVVSPVTMTSLVVFSMFAVMNVSDIPAVYVTARCVSFSRLNPLYTPVLANQVCPASPLTGDDLRSVPLAYDDHMLPSLLLFGHQTAKRWTMRRVVLHEEEGATDECRCRRWQSRNERICLRCECIRNKGMA